MKKQSYIIFFLLFIGSLFLEAQEVSFNTNCRQAYKEILALHLQEADSILNMEQRSYPDNAYVPYLKNYISFVSLFVSQDKELYIKLNSLKSDNFKAVESLSDTSGYKKWMLGNMHLQWAVLKIMFGEYLSAAIEFNSAYRLIEVNHEEFPSFRLNNLSQSVLKIIVGLVPEQYDWFLGLISMEGNIEQGKRQLSEFLLLTTLDPNYAPYFYEALFYAAFIEMNIHPDQKKLSIYKNEVEKIEDSLILMTFLQLNLFMRTGENQKALELLENLTSADKEIHPFYYLNYLKAECLLRAQDWERSIAEFDFFLENFQGENYIKDACRKKAWAAFMLEDSLLFQICMQEAQLNGIAKIDLDKEAYADAKKEHFPNKKLLLSRILFDGGYYNDAMYIMNTIDTTDYSNEELNEYIYRYARTYHHMNQLEIAKKYYGLTMLKGENADNYYAANSALKLGEIYEFEGSLIMAKEVYSACLKMEYKQYKNSINRRAREGLNRVSKELKN